MHLTPFLTLVLAGYALFMGVLGTYWARDFLDDLKQARAARRD